MELHFKFKWTLDIMWKTGGYSLTLDSRTDWSDISAPRLCSLSTKRCPCSGGLDSVWLPHAAEESVPPSWFTTQPATQRIYHLLPHSWCAERHTNTIHLVTRSPGVTWGKRYIILRLMDVTIWDKFFVLEAELKKVTAKMSTIITTISAAPTCSFKLKRAFL